MVLEPQDTADNFAEMFAALGEGAHAKDEQSGAVAAVGSSPVTVASALRDVAARPKLGERAATLTHDLFDIVEGAVQSGELDVNDALKLLPPVHRVREHEDKMEQMRNGNGNLINISWVIGTGGTISASLSPSVEVIEAADVVQVDDVDATTASEQEAPDQPTAGVVFDLLPLSHLSEPDGEMS